MATEENHSTPISSTHLRTIPSQTTHFNRDNAEVCSILMQSCTSHSTCWLNRDVQFFRCRFVSRGFFPHLLFKSRLPGTGISLNCKARQDASTAGYEVLPQCW